jgi:hypothetical protein
VDHLARSDCRFNQSASVLYLQTGRSAVVDARDPGYPIIPAANKA